MKRNKHKNHSGRRGGQKPPSTLPKPKADNSIPLSVSDHAVIRFLERVLGVDISAIRQLIAADDLINQANAVGGTGVFPCSDPNGSYWALLKRFTVITVTLTKVNLYNSKSESVSDMIARKSTINEIRTDINP